MEDIFLFFLRATSYSSHAIILGVNFTPKGELWKSIQFHLKVSASM